MRLHRAVDPLGVAAEEMAVVEEVEDVEVEVVEVMAVEEGAEDEEEAGVLSQWAKRFSEVVIVVQHSRKRGRT
tara:strand:+ start:104 stop:322 length:219 start_codon:yes stop_codon:yes gene_type:complete